VTTDHRPETMLVMNDRAFDDGFDQARLDRLHRSASVADEGSAGAVIGRACRRRGC
jgi:hypothetical protein